MVKAITQYSPYSRIRHIEMVTKQPLQVVRRACNCWCFILVCKSMSLYSIWNIMTHTDLFAVPLSRIQYDFSWIFLISLRYFNQLDPSSKAMSRHEIICTKNTAQFNYQ